MNEEFFDWLDKCPTIWFFKGDEENGRTYWFEDNEGEQGNE